MLHRITKHQISTTQSEYPLPLRGRLYMPHTAPSRTDIEQYARRFTETDYAYLTHICADGPIELGRQSKRFLKLMRRYQIPPEHFISPYIEQMIALLIPPNPTLFTPQDDAWFEHHLSTIQRLTNNFRSTPPTMERKFKDTPSALRLTLQNLQSLRERLRQQGLTRLISETNSSPSQELRQILFSGLLVRKYPAGFQGIDSPLSRDLAYCQTVCAWLNQHSFVQILWPCEWNQAHSDVQLLDTRIQAQKAIDEALAQVDRAVLDSNWLALPGLMKNRLLQKLHGLTRSQSIPLECFAQHLKWTPAQLKKNTKAFQVAQMNHDRSLRKAAQDVLKKQKEAAKEQEKKAKNAFKAAQVRILKKGSDTPFLRGEFGQIELKPGHASYSLVAAARALLLSAQLSQKIGKDSPEGRVFALGWDSVMHDLYDILMLDSHLFCVLFQERVMRQTRFGLDLRKRYGFIAISGKTLHATYCGQDVTKRAMRQSKSAKKPGDAISALSPFFEGRVKSVWDLAHLEQMVPSHQKKPARPRSNSL